MFESIAPGRAREAQRSTAPVPALCSADLASFTARLAGLPAAAVEAENIERIRLLEELKAVCAAAQAVETAALHAARREAEAARGVPAAQRCRGVAAEVALARRDGPARGSRHVGLALALVHEMPNTMAALRAGAISEWRAVLVAKETAWLPVEGRRRVDRLIAPRLAEAGDRRIAAEARAIAQALDPHEAVRHLRRAERERRVSIRPAPDAMVYLTALVPMVQGISAYAALDRSAAALTGTGQAGDRGRGQLMADMLVERLTGQETAAAVPVEVHLVMTDSALLGGFPGESDATEAAAEPGFAATSTPAWLVGAGPLPAAAARDLLDPANDGPTARARVWLRRLYTNPESGHLVSMDSRRRVFDGLLRRMVVLRDDTCRTPWCDAPIRHADHGEPHRAGGETSLSNASGLCERCNQTKENAGWCHRASPEGLEVRTPTGHGYRVETPPLLPTRPPERRPTLAATRSARAPAARPGAA